MIIVMICNVAVISRKTYWCVWYC